MLPTKETTRDDSESEPIPQHGSQLCPYHSYLRPGDFFLCTRNTLPHALIPNINLQIPRYITGKESEITQNYFVRHE